MRGAIVAIDAIHRTNLVLERCVFWQRVGGRRINRRLARLRIDNPHPGNVLPLGVRREIFNLIPHMPMDPHTARVVG